MGRKIILDIPNYTGYMGTIEFIGSVSVKDADEIGLELMIWKSVPCHLEPVPEPVVPKKDSKPQTTRGR